MQKYIYEKKVLYLTLKTYKNVQADFQKKFTFNNYHLKNNIHQSVTKLQATGTIHNLNCKAESYKKEIK